MSDMMEDAPVRQLILPTYTYEEIDSSRAVEKVALFYSDGTPFYFEEVNQAAAISLLGISEMSSESGDLSDDDSLLDAFNKLQTRINALETP